MKNKNIIFLYPCDPLHTNRVDQCYQEEYAMVCNAGMQTHIIDLDNIPYINTDAYIVYRGWMLSGDTYAQLEERCGNQLLTSTNIYCIAHYFPNWYETLKALTITSIITDEENVCAQFKFFGGKAFVKDYVKSLKTGKGSIVENDNDITNAIANMKCYRGAIEGGIVLREHVNIEPQTEIRFFVVRDVIFSPLEHVTRETYQVVEEAVKKLAVKKLLFYSVDVATLANGRPCLIEIGDGQVSDYVGWALKDFVHVLYFI